MSNKIIIVISVLTLLGGTIGGLFAFDTRMDIKIQRLEDRVDARIDDTTGPIAADVREIRKLLQQLLLQMGG